MRRNNGISLLSSKGENEMASGEHAFIERAQRFPICMPISYRKNGEPCWLSGRSIDISRTGIRFQANETLPVKSDLDFNIIFPFKVTLRGRGSVVRMEESMCAVHLHYFNLTPS
jgi:hypothetical protein